MRTVYALEGSLIALGALLFIPSINNWMFEVFDRKLRGSFITIFGMLIVGASIIILTPSEPVTDEIVYFDDEENSSIIISY